MIEDAILILWDESGFSLSPFRRRTWAPVGQTPTLLEAPRERSQTGLGFLTITPRRRHVDFRFTMIPEGLKTPECVHWLHEIHRFYRKKVFMVWDNLSAHYATASYFEEEHPDWFSFYYFPTYSPELNPVEQCWHHVKGVDLANYAARDKDDLMRKVMQSTMRINDDKKLLASFFQHAGLKI